MTATAPAVAVKDLTLSVILDHGPSPVVRDLSFEVANNETLCIIGESGSGKTLTALSLLKLLPVAVDIEHGRIELDGSDTASLSDRAMANLRGNKIAMIFQEPMTSLNPVMTIGDQIAEAVRRHRRLNRRAALAHAVTMLDMVGLPDPQRQAGNFPHQLSGGMRQRAMIAMALACDPSVLVADEPTTALDVSVQSEILKLLRDLQKRMGTAVVLITHDVGVVAEIADRVLVMYAGRQVESCSVDALFDSPLHPYTMGLLGAAPRVATDGVPVDRLQEIVGTVPRFDNLPPGCAFAPRCPHATELCHKERPALEEKRPGHVVACWMVS